MLQTIRDRATGWIAYIIIGLLVIPFAFWGINQYLGEPPPVDAAEVGEAKISLQEFQQAYQQRLARLQNMLGERFDPNLINETGLKQQVLQQLINQQLLSQAAREQGLHVGDRQLRQTILSNQTFQQDGRFNTERYQRILRSGGFSEVSYEESLRDSLTTEQLQQGLIGSAIVTSTELDRLVELMSQQREVDYVLLARDSYLEKTEVDEQAIEAYFQENQDRFLSPEQVQLQYLELTLEQMAEDIPIGEDELRAIYEQQIDKYRQAEERSASHILISLSAKADEDEKAKAQGQAQEIYAAIGAGSKTFAQALEEAQGIEGIEAGELGVIGQGMMDPAFESALYALAAVGDISEPVRTPFGFHIIQLDNVTPEKLKEFAEVRDEVEREYRLSQAEGRFYDQAETLSNLSYEQPDSLEPVAEALGLEIEDSPWFTRQGGEGIGAFPKVIAAAFSPEVLQQGLNSEAIEVEPSHIIVIRLQAHKESAPRTLEEVREDILSQLRDQQARETMTADTQALKERTEQGEALQALAEEFGGELKAAGLVNRNDAKLDPALKNQIFRLPRPVEGKPSIGSGTLTNGDQVVIVVKGVEPGKQEELQEAQRKALAQRLTNQVGAAEFQGFLDGLRQQTRVVTYGDRL